MFFDSNGKQPGFGDAGGLFATFSSEMTPPLTPADVLLV